MGRESDRSASCSSRLRQQPGRPRWTRQTVGQRPQRRARRGQGPGERQIQRERLERDRQRDRNSDREREAATEIERTRNRPARGCHRDRAYTKWQRPSKQFKHITELNKSSSDVEADMTDKQTEAKTETTRGSGRQKDIMREKKTDTENLAETAKEV